MTEQNDELYEGLDEDGGLDPAERERRITQYEDRISRYVRGVQSTGAASDKRIKAIEWLGNAAATDAIPALVEIYESDPDPKVRKAAGDALGQFRALEEKARKTSNPLQVVAEAQEQAALYGHPESGGTSRGWVLSSVALTVLAVVLFVVGAVLGGQGDGGGGETIAAVDDPPTATPAGAPEEIALAELGLRREALAEDARTLVTEFQAASRGDAIDCTRIFHNPPRYSLPAGFDANAYPQIEDISLQLNSVRDTLRDNFGHYREACEQGRSIPQTTALQGMQSIVNAERTLSQLLVELGATGVQPAALPPTATRQPTATPAPTATQPGRDAPTAEPPTETATPEEITEDDIMNEVRSLRFVIEDMNGFRGHNTLLLQYWRDVEETGDTGGCFEVVPQIPADYRLDPRFVDSSNPALNALAQAVANLNLGLSLSRQSWAVFESACNDGNLRSFSTNEVTRAETAKGAFDDATANLDTVQREVQ